MVSLTVYDGANGIGGNKLYIEERVSFLIWEELLEIRRIHWQELDRKSPLQGFFVKL